MTEAPQHLLPAAVWQDVTARYHGDARQRPPVWELPVGPLALQVMRRDGGWCWRCPYVRGWTALAAGDERDAFAAARRAMGGVLRQLTDDAYGVGGMR